MGFLSTLGLLDFHFSDSNEFLTLNEVIELFEKWHFNVRKYEPLLIEHISLPNRFNKKMYYNQLFVATKNSQDLRNKVKDNSVLRVSKSVHLSIEGVLNENEGFQYRSVELQLASGESYDGAFGVFEVLRRLNGLKSLNSILAELKKEYIVNDSFKKKIKSVLETLILRGVVEIVS